MEVPPNQQTSVPSRVPWDQLIAFGVGGVIPIALFNIAPRLMQLIGNISLGLNPFWLGAILFIPKLWDAVADPIIGHLSDNTRTRWGRRRPYMLVGGVAVAVTFVAMWWVPRGSFIRTIFPTDAAYAWFQCVFILAGVLLFYTATSIFEISHGALGLEMSDDYHDRTRLFSAKSFFGNVFAMGTPWLLGLAALPFFQGSSGDLVDGMRYVSMLVAVVLIPLVVWWFVALKEPSLTSVEARKKSTFWHDMQVTLQNKTFLILTSIIFTVAIGFNFVSLFADYITIFYLYGGDVRSAGAMLGVNGTVWAVTALVAVFPLNWISRRVGKRNTLLLAILLMCAAQASKIVCYNPALPYLVLIPTMLLSAGMLMFFTLGSSMVGDVCDEDELKRNARSEGAYYAVFWWFIQMGTALASLVSGALLLYTTFDEQQNVMVDELMRNIATIKSEAESWRAHNLDANANVRIAAVSQEFDEFFANASKLRTHFSRTTERDRSQAENSQQLLEHLATIRAEAEAHQADLAELVNAPPELITAMDQILKRSIVLKRQSPSALFRLRLLEIGVPLLLSIVSIALTLRYPLTEARCREIEQALKARRAEEAS
jgi:GPH family glycoside/pentoside/hexuronide:cation symporter